MLIRMRIQRTASMAALFVCNQKSNERHCIESPKGKSDEEHIIVFGVLLSSRGVHNPMRRRNEDGQRSGSGQGQGRGKGQGQGSVRPDMVADENNLGSDGLAETNQANDECSSSEWWWARPIADA